MANEKAMQLFKDDAFVKRFVQTASAQEAQKLIEENGGEITLEELDAIHATVKQQVGEKSYEKLNEKLNMDELDLVAGGGVFSFCNRITEMLIASVKEKMKLDHFSPIIW